MVPLWFTLSALCFVGAAVLLYVDIDRRRGRGRRRKSWARSHGFDYEQESTEILKRWKRGVMSTVGSNIPARNVVLGQIRGEAVFIFDLEEVATVIALHRKVGTNVVVDIRLKGLKEPRENDIWLLGAIVPRMVGPMMMGSSKCARVQVPMGFLRSARRIDSGPSGAPSGVGAGGRGSAVRSPFGQARVIQPPDLETCSQVEISLHPACGSL